MGGFGQKLAVALGGVVATPLAFVGAEHLEGRLALDGEFALHLDLPSSQFAYVCSNFFLTVGYFLANFERPVLGCIDAKFANEY